MTDQPKPFTVDLKQLRSRQKNASATAIETADRAGEQHGFVPREATVRRGRKPSPRTGQVHAKVLPHVADEIAAEATRRGVTQGIVIEEAWALYQTRKPG